MLIRLRVKRRPAPQTHAELKAMLTERFGALIYAEDHYGIRRTTLRNALTRRVLSERLYSILHSDYDLRHLALICECGAPCFARGDGHPLCPKCRNKE